MTQTTLPPAQLADEHVLADLQRSLADVRNFLSISLQHLEIFYQNLEATKLGTSLYSQQIPLDDPAMMRAMKKTETTREHYRLLHLASLVHVAKNLFDSTHSLLGVMNEIIQARILELKPEPAEPKSREKGHWLTERD